MNSRCVLIIALIGLATGCGSARPAVDRDTPLTACMASVRLPAAPAGDSGNTLRGRVCLEETGASVPHVLIVMVVRGRELRTGTDSSGRYVLTGIPLGEFAVQARGVGYYREERAVAFGECGVQLVDSTGKPIDGVRDVNPVTCRANQWLAFSLRPRPVF